MLRDPNKVSKELQERVAVAIKELNYIPNLNARTLASLNTDIVGVLVPSLSYTVFADVLRGIYDGLAATHLQIQVADTRYSLAEEERLIAQFLSQKVAGLIVSGVNQSAKSLSMLAEASCPIVQIMDTTPHPIDILVGFSHVDAARAITQHLLDMGYRKIGFLSGPMHRRAHGRLNGYREVLEEAGLYDPYRVEISSSPVNALTGRQFVQNLLARNVDFDALLCNNDMLALGALFEASARGLAIPADLGIAGFNDSPIMEATDPPLTTIRTPRYEVGLQAVHAIQQKLNKTGPKSKIMDMGFQIVARGSTARSQAERAVETFSAK